MCDDIIIEDRGIIIGIMHYILKNRDMLRDENILIADKRIRKIIKYLFPDMKVHKSRNTGFKINIRNQNYSDLVINNVKNIGIINAKKVRYLLWFNKDNPMIMYEHDKKYKKTQDEVLYKFRKKYRKIGCDNGVWNVRQDNRVLIRYLVVYVGLFRSVVELSNYIACYINNGINCEPVVVSVPYEVPYAVYKDRYVPVIVEGKCEKVEKKGEVVLDGLLGALTNKFEILSKYMEK